MGSGNMLEAKGGPLELRRERGEGEAPGDRGGGGKGVSMPPLHSPPTPPHAGSSALRAFKGGDFRGGSQ